MTVNEILAGIRARHFSKVQLAAVLREVVDRCDTVAEPEVEKVMPELRDAAHQFCDAVAAAEAREARIAGEVDECAAAKDRRQREDDLATADDDYLARVARACGVTG